MDPKKLDSELNKLWAKVSEPKDLPGIPGVWLPVPSDAGGMPASRGAALEALSLVKRQHRELQARWEQTLELKESAVRALTESLSRAQAEIAELRRGAQRFDARLVEEVSVLAQKLEAAHALLREEEERFAREEKRLVDSLGRLDWENRKLKERDRDRQAAYEDARDRAARLYKENESLEKDARKLAAAVREAREAMAGVLSELLTERQAREQAEEEGGRARRDLDELQGRFVRMEKLWHEERTRWGELVDRERPKPGS